jgi:hypothetical protein
MFEKALRILGNYQSSKSAARYHPNPNNTGVAFVQIGGRQGGRGGRGVREKGTAKRDGSSGGDTSNNVSTMTGCSTKGPRMNSKGESHCFHCGAANHWAYKYPELTGEQQEQLHMTLKGQAERGNGDQDKAHQLLNMMLTQARALPDNQAYLDGCLTVTAFKNGKYLKDVNRMTQGIKINCNVGVVTTNRKGTYGRLQVWHLPKGIPNIFLMHDLRSCTASPMIAGTATTWYTRHEEMCIFTRTSRGSPILIWRDQNNMRQ